MSGPELSAAVVVGAQRERAQRAIDALVVQSAAPRVEIVVIDVGPDEASELAIPERATAVYVRLPRTTGFARARGEAVRRASAPVVAFIEDHCMPASAWADALIAAHRGPWAAVGYAFTNANPDSYVSRGSMMVDYAPWAHPARHGPARLLPGNNVSYKRDALLTLGDRLDDLLVVDFNVQDMLRRRGATLFTESTAVAAHENFTSVRDLGRANYAYCRLMALKRARSHGWSMPRRLVRALLTPVGAPALKLVRLARGLRGRGRLVPAVLAALPVIVATYLWSAIGEARGYLGGDEGQVQRDFTHWELDTARADKGTNQALHPPPW